MATMRSIMVDFAKTTGLSDSPVKPRRYLWTDAFAVCNFLELYRQSQHSDYLDLAIKLVEQVHTTLGKFHPDDIKETLNNLVEFWQRQISRIKACELRMLIAL